MAMSERGVRMGGRDVTWRDDGDLGKMELQY